MLFNALTYAIPVIAGNTNASVTARTIVYGDTLCVYVALRRIHQAICYYALAINHAVFWLTGAFESRVYRHIRTSFVLVALSVVAAFICKYALISLFICPFTFSLTVIALLNESILEVCN